MTISQKNYEKILNELNKKYEPKNDRNRQIANWIIIVIIGSFLGWLAIVGATQ